MAIQRTVERKIFALHLYKGKNHMNTRNLDCLQKINLPLYLYMGIYKASYNRISKSSFTSPRENIKRLSGKIFSPLLIQRKNWSPLCADKTKKTYTSTHNETRGAVCIPISSYCACMYKSLNWPFCISIFIPRPRGCSILTQSFLFVQSEWKNYFFFVYCGADFNP